MMRLRFRVAILAMLAGVEGAAGPVAGQARDQVNIEVGAFRGIYSCAHDRILAGQDGEVAVWEGDDGHLLGSLIHSPGEVIVGRMHESGRAAGNRFHLYTGGGQVFFPIRWAGRDGILFARTRDLKTRILSLNADGRPVTELARLGRRWRPIALNAISHGGIEALVDPALEARMKPFDGTTFVRGQATLGATLELVGARRSDLELVKIGAASLEPVGLNAEYTHAITLHADSRRYAGGIAYLGAPSSGRLGYLPYQRPLIDQATGRIAGKFGPGGILLEGKTPLKRSLARFRQMHGQSRIVVDASLSGHHLMILTLAGRGNRAIVRIGPTGISEQPICTDWFVPNPRLRTSPNPLVSPDTGYRPLFRAFTLDPRGRETLEAGRPILTVHRFAGRPARDAILYLHGGPGATNATRHHQMLHLDTLLAPGRDIVSLEYSGSIGGGSKLTARLGERGLAALEQDLDAVVAWLDRRKYRRVFIVASSFGGIPALVALDRHRRRFEAAFFFVPILKWPEPEEHVNRGRYDSIDPQTQRAFEHALLGGAAGRERFKADLAALVRRAPLQASDHFHFAERDPTSMPAHLPAGTAATHEVFPGLHMTAFAHPKAWEAIERRIR